MESTVNSYADDEFAHPWDDPDTMEDEAMDGVCEDYNHRCTLRAALEEASYLNTSARVVFSGNGIITMDPLQGPFYPPDDSWVQGYQQNVSILGDNTSSSIIFAIGNYTLLSGMDLSNALIGIEVGGDHNRIGLDNPESANYIHDMGQNGILINGDSNRVTGNVIGLDLLGAAEGSPFGLFVFGTQNVIGGIHPGEGNVISGNDKGVTIYSLDSLNEIAYVVGNKIGTTINGTGALGNKVGIEVIGYNTIIGGNTPEAMNVISGNTESGILTGIQATGIEILGNHIGVDQTGNTLIPNRDGIVLGPGSQSCLVEGNLIQGNSQFGIFMSGLPDSSLTSAYHDIRGNTIVMNSEAGIGIANHTHDVVVGYGLDNMGAPNQIQFNGNGGVIFSQTFGIAEYNTIRKNNLKQNHLKGINIKTFCPNCQGQILAPEIVEVTDVGNAMFEVVGTHARAGSIIDVYSGDLNQSGQFEGLHWLGSGVVDPDHIFQFLVEDCGCDLVVATATDPQGNTSEFSIGTLVTMTSVAQTEIHNMPIRAIPNPFTQQTSIRYSIEEPGDVLLCIYDVQGHKIETLYEGRLAAGEHEESWNAGSMASGVYYYKLVLNDRYVEVGKILRFED